jgi:hypothetical protein
MCKGVITSFRGFFSYYIYIYIYMNNICNKIQKYEHKIKNCDSKKKIYI